MKRMRYDFTKESGLNFGKEKWALLHSFVPKGKAPDYYHKTRRGLDYVSTPVSSDFESEEEVDNDCSSITSSCDWDVSVGVIFESLSVNMISTSHLEKNEEDIIESEELIQSDFDPWIKHLNTLWDIRFEQRVPPNEDKVTQINLGDEANPKPIFISESLSPSEKEDLRQLIWEYIDVFAWNYEDMFGSNSRLLCIISTQPGRQTSQPTVTTVSVSRSWKQSIRS